MKLLLAAVLSFTLSQVTGFEKETEREMARHLLSECQRLESGTDDDLNKLMNEEIPSTDTGKCILACGYEKLGFVSFSKFRK
jgi:PBP/GOBP family